MFPCFQTMLIEWPYRVWECVGRVDMEQQNLEQRIAELEQYAQRLEQQLLQADKMGTVGVLASSITHEFNNVLTTVINYAKMGMRHKDDATRDKAFDKILAAGQRAAKITTGMLSYARSSDSRKDDHELVHLLDDVLVLVEKDLSKHRVSLVKQIDAQPRVTVNPSQIQQLLLNLLINARQAMESGGTLTVRVAEGDRFAEIHIRDTGCGIPAETLPHIFDSFFTTKKADAAGQGGSGLGLSLCKQIIEAHQGRIRVESTIGVGTEFTIKLPLAQSAGLTHSINKAG